MTHDTYPCHTQLATPIQVIHSDTYTGTCSEQAIKCQYDIGEQFNTDLNNNIEIKKIYIYYFSFLNFFYQLISRISCMGIKNSHCRSLTGIDPKQTTHQPGTVSPGAALQTYWTPHKRRCCQLPEWWSCWARSCPGLALRSTPASWEGRREAPPPRSSAC